MKVLFVTNIPSPYRIDFYNELGKYLDVTVIFEAKGAEGIRFNWNINEIRNFRAIFLSEGNIKENKLDWRIFKYLKIKEFDEIVLTNYYYRTEMIALLYLKIMRKPYYFESDGGLIKNESKIKRFYKRILVSGAKGYFSPSKSTDDYLQFYGANKDRIYRYPFTSLKNEDILHDIVSTKDKLNIRLNLGMKEEKIIISVGQFIYRKGYDVLLKACERLDKNIGVYIIGGKVTSEYLEMKEKLNLTNVYFEEFKDKETLKKYYKAADLFVLPTREDIWGLVINEAMSCGLPIITTNKCVAGIELVKDMKNGKIVEVEDYIELSEYMKKILDNKDIENMQRESLKRIRNYSIEKMVEKHLEILKY